MCDKQKLVNNGNVSQYCSCIQMQFRGGVVGINAQINAILRDRSSISFHDFSSQHFWETFVINSFPPAIRADDLNQFEAYERIEDAADAVIDYVNARGGWSGIGWTKQGQVVDAAAAAAAGPLPFGAQPQFIPGGNIRHHLVRLYPTDPARVRYQELKNLKIDLVASEE